METEQQKEQLHKEIEEFIKSDLAQLIILFDRMRTNYEFEYLKEKEIKIIRVSENWNYVNFVFDIDGKFIKIGNY